MYDKTHDTPYFNMKTDCDYIGKCFAILIIYCGGILVVIIDVLNQFLCKIVYVHCIKTIVYDFLYKKVLMGVIRKFKSVYDLLMARIHCWQTTSVNNVNAIIGNEPKCCVCLKPWDSNLSDVEKAAIDTHGLYDLSGFLPKKPTDVELKVMKEMFEASVDGEAYDMDRWGQYFKPAGMGQATGDPNKAVVRAPVVDEDADDAPAVASAPASAPAAPAATADGASRAQDILAMIRNRQKQ